MSEIKLISPMLDNFAIGDPISDHHGVRSCPAMNEQTEEKYIVKIISTPASATQLDALLLSGAYSTKEDALRYYESVAKETEEEVVILNKLAELDGFFPFEDYQTVSMDDGCGYDLYLLGTYKKSLARYFQKDAITHLSALNLGLDLCAALTVCRRSGYIYVNLKPDNIYLTKDNGYRIGDIGFLKLDSLKYASLPDRYRSAYTAPELSDAFASLNTTIDVYAVGLILYQAFNGGILPNVAEGESLPAPDYADYEMAEIILKACAADPSDRFEDPTQMGHALVGYMQRNGAHDTPIVPPTIPEPEVVESEDGSLDEPMEEIVTAEIEEEPTHEEITEVPATTSNFIPDEDDQTLPGADTEDLELDDISEEISEMLSQADELISHPTPEPVVAPEPAEIVLPEIETQPEQEDVVDAVTAEDAETCDSEEPTESSVSQEETETAAEADDQQVESSTEATIDPSQIITDTDESDDYDEDDAEGKKPKRRWIGYLILCAVLAALIAAGIFYYNHIYVQKVDKLTLVGEANTLTVQLTTSADEKLLTVVCADTHGTPHSAPVVDGKATFKNLEYGVPYSVTVSIDGFHTLKGETTAEYATPKLTKITGITAVTGNEDGSAILQFNIEGPDAAKWIVTYGAEGEESKTVETDQHSAELQGLTVGSEYTIVITPADAIQFQQENNSIKHTARNAVLPEDVYITGYADGVVTVTWQVPEDAQLLTWEIWCHDKDENGYTKTTVSQLPTATFEGLDPAVSYRIEVRASGMYDAVTVDVPANAVSIQNLNTEFANGKTVFTWETGSFAPQSPWILEEINTALTHTGTTENRFEINNLVPGHKYQFILKTGSEETDALLLGNVINCQVPETVDFEGYGVTKQGLSYRMCFTPEEDDWADDSLTPSDYTTSFPVGSKASILAQFGYYIERSTDSIEVLYVIRDENGDIISSVAETEIWNDMWYWYGKRGMGTFDLPEMPNTIGTYTLDIYFNSALALTQEFNITQ